MSIEEPYLQRVQSQLSGYSDARHSQALLSCLPHSPVTATAGPEPIFTVIERHREHAPPGAFSST